MASFLLLNYSMTIENSLDEGHQTRGGRTIGGRPGPTIRRPHTSGARSEEVHLPADDFLPHLANGVNGEVMRVRLQEAMFAGETSRRIERCVVERVKYRPRQRCTIGYRLAIRDDDEGRLHDHFLTARMFEPKGAADRFRKYRSGCWIAPDFGPPLLHLDDLDMILWSFPNDRHLPALPLLIDKARLGDEAILPLVERRFGSDWSIASLSPTLVSYVHERRCTVKVDLALRSTAGERRDWSVFGKISGDDSDAMTAEASVRYWRDLRLAERGFDMPESLGGSANGRIAWQEAMAGTPLASGRNSKFREGDFRLAGAALTALHGSTAVGARTSGLDAVLNRLRERGEAIVAWPAYRSRIRTIIERLTAAATALDRETHVAAHGDLHGRNILIDGQRVALIDLDEAISGPPAGDLGHFAAYTLFEALDGGELDGASRAIAAFIEAYRQTAAWPIPITDIVWHTAAALVTEKIFREVTLMQPDRRRRIERLIALAERFSRGDGSALGLDADAAG